MPNIKFSYRYRDSANYKKHGYIIFANPNQVDLQELKSIIRAKLIDDTWFYASQWGLPDQYLATFNFDIDPTWHEFDGVEYSEDLPTPNYASEDFIQRLTAIHP